MSSIGCSKKTKVQTNTLKVQLVKNLILNECTFSILFSLRWVLLSKTTHFFSFKYLILRQPHGRGDRHMGREEEMAQEDEDSE